MNSRKPSCGNCERSKEVDASHWVILPEKARQEKGNGMLWGRNGAEGNTVDAACSRGTDIFATSK